MNRKKIVRAFAKIAKRFWRFNNKSARNWARCTAKSYNAEILEGYADWIDTPLNEWTQYEYDSFVEEEISYW